MLFINDLESMLIPIVPLLDQVLIRYIIEVFDRSNVIIPEKRMKLSCCYLIVK